MPANTTPDASILLAQTQTQEQNTQQAQIEALKAKIAGNPTYAMRNTDIVSLANMQHNLQRTADLQVEIDRAAALRAQYDGKLRPAYNPDSHPEDYTNAQAAKHATVLNPSLTTQGQIIHDLNANQPQPLPEWTKSTKSKAGYDYYGKPATFSGTDKFGIPSVTKTGLQKGGKNDLALNPQPTQNAQEALTPFEKAVAAQAQRQNDFSNNMDLFKDAFKQTLGFDKPLDILGTNTFLGSAVKAGQNTATKISGKDQYNSFDLNTAPLTLPVNRFVGELGAETASIPFTLGGTASMAIEKEFLLGGGLAQNPRGTLGETFNAGIKAGDITLKAATLRDANGRITPESIADTALIYLSPLPLAFKATAGLPESVPRSTPKASAAFDFSSAPRGIAPSLTQARAGVPPEFTFEVSNGKPVFQTVLAKGGADPLSLLKQQLTEETFSNNNLPRMPFETAGRAPQQTTLNGIFDIGVRTESGKLLNNIPTTEQILNAGRLKGFNDNPYYQRSLTEYTNPTSVGTARQALIDKLGASNKASLNGQDIVMQDITRSPSIFGNKRGSLNPITDFGILEKYKNPNSLGKPYTKGGLLNEAAPPAILPFRPSTEPNLQFPLPLYARIPTLKNVATPSIQTSTSSVGIQNMPLPPTHSNALTMLQWTRTPLSEDIMKSPRIDNARDTAYMPRSRQSSDTDNALKPAQDIISIQDTMPALDIVQITASQPKINTPSIFQNDNPNTKQPDIPKLLPSIMLQKGNNKEFPRFSLEIGKKGNKYYFNFPEASIDDLSRGVGLVKGTAAASIKITPLNSSAADIDLSRFIDKTFKKGKNDRYVQLNATRISSAGEKQQITGESQRLRITQGKTKKRALDLVSKGMSLREIRKSFKKGDFQL